MPHGPQPPPACSRFHTRRNLKTGFGFSVLGVIMPSAFSAERNTSLMKQFCKFSSHLLSGSHPSLLELDASALQNFRFELWLLLVSLCFTMFHHVSTFLSLELHPSASKLHSVPCETHLSDSVHDLLAAQRRQLGSSWFPSAPKKERLEPVFHWDDLLLFSAGLVWESVRIRGKWKLVQTGSGASLSHDQHLAGRASGSGSVLGASQQLSNPKSINNYDFLAGYAACPDLRIWWWKDIVRKRSCAIMDIYSFLCFIFVYAIYWGRV